MGQPPDELWARIEESLAQARAEGRRRRALLGAWRGPIVVALIVALGVLGLVIHGSGWRPPDLRHARIVKESVEALQGFIASRRPLDRASGDPAALQRWLEGKVDFAPPPPALSPALELRGARLEVFLQRRVAAYIYRADGRPVALYVMPAAGLAMAEETGATLAGGPAAIGQLRGFTSVYWRDGDLAYALVADLEPARLLELAATLIRPG